MYYWSLFEGFLKRVIPILYAFEEKLQAKLYMYKKLFNIFFAFLID